jgi:transcriptional regulator with XRE-family HTH domain
MMNSVQCKMARAALGWSAAELARRADVGVATVNRFEAQPIPSTAAAMERTFEAAGIEFTNGDTPGVRVRSRHVYGTVWSKRPVAELFTLRDGRVFRAHDGLEVGTVIDGSIHDMTGEFVCPLVTIESRGVATDLPAAVLKLLD